LNVFGLKRREIESNKERPKQQYDLHQILYVTQA
jgi:hypothetical protein